MTSSPRTHLPPRLLPILYFGAAHVALALAFGAVAVDPRGLSGIAPVDPRHMACL